MISAMLSASSVKLFGQLVSDLVIRPTDDATNQQSAVAARTSNFNLANNAPASIDGVNLAANNLILFTKQNTKSEHGLYKFIDTNKPFLVANFDSNKIVKVTSGDEKNKTNWLYNSKSGKFRKLKDNQLNRAKSRKTENNFLTKQVDFEEAGFARIFGFSHDGRYFDLERPTIFLVHGEGEELTDDDDDKAFSPPLPSDSGLGAAEFQFARDMRYWEYDKADFTVRMDMFAGMFEEVLLGFELDGGDDPMDGGGSVGGGRVGGGRVGGGRVGGGRVGGGRVGGG